MAKVTVSVRVEPEIVARIDEAASLLNTTRGKLLAATVEEGWGGSMTPLDMARALLDQNAARILGDYLVGVADEALEQTKTLREAGANMPS